LNDQKLNLFNGNVVSASSSNHNTYLAVPQFNKSHEVFKVFIHVKNKNKPFQFFSTSTLKRV